MLQLHVPQYFNTPYTSLASFILLENRNNDIRYIMNIFQEKTALFEMIFDSIKICKPFSTYFILHIVKENVNMLIITLNIKIWQLFSRLTTNHELHVHFFPQNFYFYQTFLALLIEKSVQTMFDQLIDRP